MFRPTASQNSASYSGTASPGALITLFGEGMGPESAMMSPLHDGRIATSLAGTQVLVDGDPAPLYYTSAGQLSFFMPFRVAGENTADVEVVYNGLRSYRQSCAVLPTSPGIFTQNASSSGPGAILNED